MQRQTHRSFLSIVILLYLVAIIRAQETKPPVGPQKIVEQGIAIEFTADPLAQNATTIEAGAVLKEADSVGWTPAFYTLGSLVGRNIADSVSMKMKDKVFLAFPTVPADVSAAGAAEYSALLQRNTIDSTHAAAQASAIAAARILVHALELCGKDLSREGLVTKLEGLYEYETALLPKITFGPNRRIGALGAYVVTIDPEKKLFPASLEWIPVD